jgi:hypothetical protein
MRMLASSVLTFEACVAFFFGLVAGGLGVAHGWQVAVPLIVASVALAGLLRFKWAYAAGWVLQAGMVGAGALVTAMYFLGVVFGALWWAALHYGAKVDAAKAARAAG